MTDKNDFDDIDCEGSPETYTVLARNIIWPSGVNLPTVARVEVPGWLDGRSQISTGRSDWRWATIEALQIRFGRRPDSINIPPVGSSLGLHLICDGCGGDNRDLLVWATDADEAVALWTLDFELSESDRPDRIFLVPTNTKPSPGALRWHKDVEEKHPTF